MKKNLYLIFVLLAFTACGNKSKNNSSELEDDPAELIEIERRAYKDGHAYGSDDASDGKPYLTSCNTKSGYDLWGTKKQSQSWAKGFRKGYDDGYNEGKSAPRTEYENSNVTVTTSSTPNTYSSPNSSTVETDFHNVETDFHKWEEDEIKAFYVEIEDCESDEQAEYISNQYYLGEYIEEYGRYFAKTSVKNGTYEAEIGEKVSSKLFKIKGTDIFMLFKWLPNASKWDEGVLDVWANKGTFYKKPE